MSRRPSSTKRWRTRARSSPAARSVNVMARIRAGRTPSSSTERTKRSTSTEVLPLPALASSSSEPSRRRTASDCSAVNGRPPGPISGRGVMHAHAASQRQIVGYAQPLSLYVHVCGPRLERAGAQLGDGGEHVLEHAVDDRVEVLRRAAVGPHRPQAGVGVGEHEPAGALLLAADRLVQAAERVEAEHVARGEQVQRDLVLALRAPARRLDRDAALVVVDERLPRRVLVDAVDAPAQPHAAGQLERADGPRRRRRRTSPPGARARAREPSLAACSR